MAFPEGVGSRQGGLSKGVPLYTGFLMYISVILYFYVYKVCKMIGILFSNFVL